MDDIHEIRRKRLREWIDTDPNSKGVVEAWCAYYSQFADRPINPVHIRQIVPKRGTPTSNLGETRARSLEAAGGKPRGWLDLDTDDPQSTGQNDSPAHAAKYVRSPVAIAAAIEQMLEAHGLTMEALIDGGVAAASDRIAEAIFPSKQDVPTQTSGGGQRAARRLESIMDSVDSHHAEGQSERRHKAK